MLGGNSFRFVVFVDDFSVVGGVYWLGCFHEAAGVDENADCFVLLYEGFFDLGN